jgi:hypothetical protein
LELGKEHPSTLTSMSNLGSVLSDQGKYEQAEEMHRKTLALCETVLGKEHPSTLTNINNLGLTLSAQGKYEQGEEMHSSISCCWSASSPHHVTWPIGAAAPINPTCVQLLHQ